MYLFSIDSQVMVVARAILDFCYYAQLRVHTNNSLDALDNTLATFHANKDIMKELGIRDHFNLPKLHQLSHYVQSITLFGTADGFNTELPERLHIDFAKEAYRASNKRDYEEQMVMWLQRQDAVLWRSSYLYWLSEHSQMHAVTRRSNHESGFESDLDDEVEDSESDSTMFPSHSNSTLPVNDQPTVRHLLAKTPAHPRQSVQHLEIAHGATSFLPSLQLFLTKHLPYNNVIPGPHDRFDVFRQVIIVAPADPRVSDLPRRWRIRATPTIHPSTRRKRGSPAHFDMALVSDGVQSPRWHTLPEGMSWWC